MPVLNRGGLAATYAGLVHVFCWYAQIHPGHGIYEGRKPALLDSVLQAFLDAPLFVWYEVAFACGYDPALKQELDAAVEKQHAAWDPRSSVSVVTRHAGRCTTRGGQ